MPRQQRKNVTGLARTVKPVRYEPVVLSQKTIELVNNHIDTYRMNRDADAAVYDKDTAKFCFMATDDQLYAIFYRPDVTKEWSKDNCEQALVGFSVQCNGANARPICNACASALARCIVVPTTRTIIHKVPQFGYVVRSAGTSGGQGADIK